MNTWQIRKLFTRIINQWYLLLVFLLAGSLLGYGLGWILPSKYQAAANLYVGIDIERVNDMEFLIPLAKSEPLNLDDYKNWQLKQIADITNSREVLNNTLNKLQAESSVWDEVSRTDFRSQSEIYWYDTGTWQLRVTAEEAEQAGQAADIWLETTYHKLSDLMVYSDQAAELDSEIQAYNTVISSYISEKQDIKHYLEVVEEQKFTLEANPPGQILGSAEREALQQTIADHSGDISSGIIALEDFPDEGQTVRDYLDWFTASLSGMENRIAILEEKQSDLEVERSAKLELYHQALENSLGISANVVLEPLINDTLVEVVRNPGLTALAGLTAGLIFWFVITFYRVAQVEGRDD
jgi:hypothetical protein